MVTACCTTRPKRRASTDAVVEGKLFSSGSVDVAIRLFPVGRERPLELEDLLRQRPARRAYVAESDSGRVGLRPSGDARMGGCDDGVAGRPRKAESRATETRRITCRWRQTGPAVGAPGASALRASLRPRSSTPSRYTDPERTESRDSAPVSSYAFSGRCCRSWPDAARIRRGTRWLSPTGS